MYILAPNQTIEKYPYSIGELRRDNPSTSFPRRPPDEILEQWGVLSVTRTDSPSFDPITQNLTEGTPMFANGQWAQTWVVSDATNREIEQRTEQRLEDTRNQRNRLLSETDWIVIMHTERGTNIPAVWELYRQALRDITSQGGFPYTIEWPTKPGE